MSQPVFDEVLQVTPPSFSEAEAVTIGSETFGVDAASAENLGSERDQTFLLLGAEGPRAVMKVSNPAEDTDMLDMEALVVHHTAGPTPRSPSRRRGSRRAPATRTTPRPTACAWMPRMGRTTCACTT